LGGKCELKIVQFRFLDSNLSQNFSQDINPVHLVSVVTEIATEILKFQLIKWQKYPVLAKVMPVPEFLNVVKKFWSCSNFFGQVQILECGANLLEMERIWRKRHVQNFWTHPTIFDHVQKFLDGADGLGMSRKWQNWVKNWAFLSFGQLLFLNFSCNFSNDWNQMNRIMYCVCFSANFCYRSIWFYLENFDSFILGQLPINKRRNRRKNLYLMADSGQLILDLNPEVDAYLPLPVCKKYLVILTLISFYLPVLLPMPNLNVIWWIYQDVISLPHIWQETSSH